jgi:hypothetical protein
MAYLSLWATWTCKRPTAHDGSIVGGRAGEHAPPVQLSEYGYLNEGVGPDGLASFLLPALSFLPSLMNSDGIVSDAYD